MRVFRISAEAILGYAFVLVAVMYALSTYFAADYYRATTYFPALLRINTEEYPQPVVQSFAPVGSARYVNPDRTEVPVVAWIGVVSTSTGTSVRHYVLYSWPPHTGLVPAYNGYMVVGTDPSPGGTELYVLTPSGRIEYGVYSGVGPPDLSAVAFTPVAGYTLPVSSPEAVFVHRLPYGYFAVEYFSSDRWHLDIVRPSSGAVASYTSYTMMPIVVYGGMLYVAVTTMNDTVAEFNIETYPLVDGADPAPLPAHPRAPPSVSSSSVAQFFITVQNNTLYSGYVLAKISNSGTNFVVSVFRYSSDGNYSQVFTRSYPYSYSSSDSTASSVQVRPVGDVLVDGHAVVAYVPNFGYVPQGTMYDNLLFFDIDPASSSVRVLARPLTVTNGVINAIAVLYPFPTDGSVSALVEQLDANRPGYIDVNLFKVPVTTPAVDITEGLSAEVVSWDVNVGPVVSVTYCARPSAVSTSGVVTSGESNPAPSPAPTQPPATTSGQQPAPPSDVAYAASTSVSPVAADEVAILVQDVNNPSTTLYLQPYEFQSDSCITKNIKVPVPYRAGDTYNITVYSTQFGPLVYTDAAPGAKMYVSLSAVAPAQQASVAPALSPDNNESNSESSSLQYIYLLFYRDHIRPFRPLSVLWITSKQTWLGWILVLLLLYLSWVYLTRKRR